MTALLAFVAGYLALLMLLTYLVRERREQLGQLALALLEDHPSETIEFMLRHSTRTAYSLAVAPIQVLQLLALLLTPSAVLERKALDFVSDKEELIHDDRYALVIANYNLSVAAANPIFGALAYVLRAALKMKLRFYIRNHHENERALKAFRKCTI